MSAVRVATGSDASEIGRIFGLGFEDDPVLSWVFRDPGRVVKLTSLFTFLVTETFVPPGSTWMTAGAASAWEPPDPPERDDAHLARFGAALVGGGCTDDDLERLATMGEVVQASHPDASYWYLGVLATLPDQRAQGLGSALLTRSLAGVDATGMPAYLESSNPRNISLYERHGFEVTGRIDIADGVFMTPMWRPAR